MKTFLTSITILLAFSQVLSQNTATVTIDFDSPPSAVSVSTAPLRYNKQFAYSFTFDDGKADAYTNGYPLLNSLYYTDGCGTSIPFRAGIAWTSKNNLGEDTHINTPELMNWNQLMDLHNKGWNVFNHSLTHATGAGTDYDYEVKENIDYVMEKTGIKLKLFVIPSGDSNYIPFATAHGMKGIFNQNSFPGVNGLNIDGNLNLNNFRLNRRFLSDDKYNLSNISNYTDQVAAESTPQNHFWYSEFTHHVATDPMEGSLVYSTFEGYMKYLEKTYGKTGNDILWFSPLQEVYEYTWLAKSTPVQTTISGNKASISLNLQNTPDNFDKYAFTFLVNADQQITSVNADQAQVTYTNSGNQKLVNIEWKSKPISIATGSEKQFTTTGYQMTPNPAGNYLSINSSSKNFPVNYLIRDISGRKSGSGTIEKNDFTIGVQELPSGFYFIEIIDSKDQHEVLKFMKQ